jgi:hypothetical protein
VISLCTWIRHLSQLNATANSDLTQDIDPICEKAKCNQLSTTAHPVKAAVMPAVISVWNAAALLNQQLYDC